MFLARTRFCPRCFASQYGSTDFTRNGRSEETVSKKRSRNQKTYFGGYYQKFGTVFQWFVPVRIFFYFYFLCSFLRLIQIFSEFVAFTFDLTYLIFFRSSKTTEACLKRCPKSQLQKIILADYNSVTVYCEPENNWSSFQGEKSFLLLYIFKNFWMTVKKIVSTLSITNTWPLKKF